MVDVTVPMDDAELFRSAVADAPPAREAEPERQQPEPQAKAPAESDGRSRDEHGRFAPKADEPAPKPDAAAKPQEGQQPADPDQSAQVPSWRLREISEDRQRVAKELEQERQTRTRLEMQLREFHARQQQTTAEPPKDFLEDPDGYIQRVVQQQQSEISRVRFELSEDQARGKFGDAKVDEALKWLQQGNLDAPTRQRITTARNPYGEMVKLYDERQTLSQIGGDLGAYRAKLQEEFLNDPGFMEKVAAKLRGDQSNGTTTNGQRPVVNLPPSLSRAPSAHVPRDDAAGDMSDPSLYAYATAPGRRG